MIKWDAMGLILGLQNNANYTTWQSLERMSFQEKNFFGI
jgi:hypothetical protein